MITRRKFLSNSTALGGAAALSSLLPPWARSALANETGGLKSLSGTVYDLHINKAPVTIDGRHGVATTVNGQLPAPLLRWREGDELTLNVTNHLEEDTSIHWHGILLPFEMDGVPGVTFPGIKPGETFTYRFPLKQAGTYWYHSHSGLQEQSGHYGPIIIEPIDTDPVEFDREYVVVLSDWTFHDPYKIFAKLKKNGESFNYQKRTAKDFFTSVKKMGLSDAVKDRNMWAQMRMSPTDIADVTGETYTYLVNGHGPADNWTALFRPGERVRLRFINTAAMSLFNVRIPGLAMTVVQADGLNVKPVETDEFQIGVAETFDVIVQPAEDKAYTIMCESMDRSGYGRATLAPRAGMAAAIPALRKRPTLTMKDMGMAHHGNHGGGKTGAHDEGQGEKQHDHSQMDHEAMAIGETDHGAMDHDTMGHGEMNHGSMGEYPHNHRNGPGVANNAMMPVNRLHEPGLGLDNQPHRVLVYTHLQSLEPNPDRREPGRELELHLTGNMHRYMWSFDGIKFSEIKGPIIFEKGERLRLTLVNDTMMTHPIHLHGMFFDVVTHDGTHKPRKHTIAIKPGEKLSVDITADAPGDWAFHCHLLYHMHAGMMRVVSVRDRIGKDEHAHHEGHHG